MNFRLRPWHISDANNLARYANNYNIARFMTDAFPHPYTLEDANRFIEQVSQAHPLKVMAIEVNGEAAGGIGVFPQADIMRLNAEMGYWLAEPYWGLGITSKAIAEMISYAFNTFDIQRIYARPFGNNKASQHVLEKAGFLLEAHIRNNIIKNGEVLDEMIYAIRRPQ